MTENILYIDKIQSPKLYMSYIKKLADKIYLFVIKEKIFNLNNFNNLNIITNRKITIILNDLLANKLCHNINESKYGYNILSDYHLYFNSSPKKLLNMAISMKLSLRTYHNLTINRQILRKKVSDIRKDMLYIIYSF